MLGERRADKCKLPAESVFALAELTRAHCFARRRHPRLLVFLIDHAKRFCSKLRMQAGPIGHQRRFVQTATAE